MLKLISMVVVRSALPVLMMSKLVALRAEGGRRGGGDDCRAQRLFWIHQAGRARRHREKKEITAGVERHRGASSPSDEAQFPGGRRENPRSSS